MPELKKAKIDGFSNDTSFDFNNIKYKDKQKESSRQKKLEVYRETGHWPGMKQKPTTSKPWSDKQDAKGRRLDRKRKKEIKITHQDQNDLKDDEDLEDLENDIKILKKMKKGKVSVIGANLNLLASSIKVSNTLLKHQFAYQIISVSGVSRCI